MLYGGSYFEATSLNKVLQLRKAAARVPMDRHQAYDRQLLLHGAKRNAVLELWEVERYGTESYGDSDYVSIYGLPPREWYARGIRLLGRTAVECTRDELADTIGRDIAAVATKLGRVPSLVIDPFAGSGNTLYWILRHLPEARGLGCELDAAVFNSPREPRGASLPVRSSTRPSQRDLEEPHRRRI